MSTSYTGRPSVSTSYTGRPSIAITNTLAIIIAGVWIDGATWTETGKYWNDAGDGAGTVFTGRPLI